MIIKSLLLSMTILPLVSCTAGTVKREEQIAAMVENLVEAGRIDEAIQKAEPLADSKNPELVFSVGYLYLARSEIEDRDLHQKREDSDRFLNQIKLAALAGLEEAPRLLEAVYRFGGYGTIARDHLLAECWRQVIDKEIPARRCTDNDQMPISPR